ncbi:MAG: FAD:protein FMN transferase [Phycisphaerae bacterium]|nr:FAD:protein FMN transferase [Phycisphaerae bacterium]
MPTDMTPTLHRFAHDAMATTFEVVLAAGSRTYAEAAADAAFAEIDRLEHELSRFIPDSDIARVNALRPGDTLQVGIDAFECLQLAEAVWRETGGAFDVTVGGFLPRSGASPPAASPPAAGRQGDAPDAGDHGPNLPAAVGMPLIELDPARRQVHVRSAGVVVDLGAVGKGYAVDQAVEILGQWRLPRGLVHAGQSSVFAFGEAPDPDAPPGAGWPAPIRDPLDHSRTLGRVRLRQESLSGSGRALHGEHILDPRTGLPAPAETAGAWAVAPSAAMSDAFSTAFMILPPPEVEACCRRVAGLSAILAARHGERTILRSFGPAEFVPSGDAAGDARRKG